MRSKLPKEALNLIEDFKSASDCIGQFSLQNEEDAYEIKMIENEGAEEENNENELIDTEFPKHFDFN